MTVKKTLASLSVLLIFVVGAANGVPAKRYTAKAWLVISGRQPTILVSGTEKVDGEEFAIFRNMQAELVHGRFVIQAWRLRNRQTSRKLPLHQYAR